MDAARRIAELKAALLRADHHYYNLGAPEISDAEYDALYRELQQLERAHPELVTPDSPTQRVGAPLPAGSGFATREHLTPMLSLDSLLQPGEVLEFDERARRLLRLDAGTPLDWVVEPKLDGVSASLVYEDGQFVRGLSRGDGYRGEEITRNLRAIRTIPLRLHGAAPPLLEIRGEVILSRAAFETLQHEATTSTAATFKNARNTVAGTLKLLDPATVERRGLEFLCWGFGQQLGLEVRTQTEMRARLAELGFRLSPNARGVRGIDGVLEYQREFELARADYPYEIDGIVAKLDRLDWQQALGTTARAPRWAFAFKFQARRATTRVARISVSVGRTGVVTPVAELEPVDIGGVTVKRATLHNFALLAQRDVRAGDTVEVERGGDVIPAVVAVDLAKRPPDSRPFAPPERCPTCGTPLERGETFVVCPNIDCRDQIRGRIVHLASRRALDIEGLGPKNVDQLIDAGLIQHPEDVFRLPDQRERIEALEGWGARSFDKLAAAIRRSLDARLAAFLHALGIPHVGEQTARALAAAFGELDALRRADLSALERVEDVGPEVARAVHDFFRHPATERFLAAALAAGLRLQAPPRSGAGPLAGRVFCFTGGLDAMPRDEARQRVERLGARTSPSVTKKVTDVVAGAEAGSKLDKARQLGARILDEAAFLALLGAAEPPA